MLRSWAAIALGALIALAAAGTLGSRAHAQQAGGRDAEARMLFQAGQVAFEEGRFENALEYFRRSYDLSGRAELLYNIGTAADRLRMDRDALEAFRRYVAERPDAPNRAEVEARIGVLERAVAAASAGSSGGGAAASGGQSTGAATATSGDAAGAGGATATSPDTGVAASAGGESRSSGGGGGDAGSGIAAWVVMGAGLAVAVAGAVLVGLAAADVSSIENAPAGSAWADYAGAYDRTEPMSIAGSVLLGVGVATAIAGVAWGIAGSGGGSGEARASISVGPGGVGVRGSF